MRTDPQSAACPPLAGRDFEFALAQRRMARMSGGELAAVRVVVRRELRRRPVADERASTRHLRSALAKLDAIGSPLDGPAGIASAD